MGNDEHSFGCEIKRYETLDSTNSEACAWARMGAPHGSVVVSESQTNGHGRMDRSWHSPKGGNIYMTVILRPDIRPKNASMLTLVAGLAVARAIEAETKSRNNSSQNQQNEHNGIDGITIKWPNDILLDGKKISGILTGAETDGENLDFVYVGIGVNVNTEDFPEELRDKATSLCNTLPGSRPRRDPVSAMQRPGPNVDTEGLRMRILREFEELYDSFVKWEDLRELKDEYNERLINVGRQVKIKGKVEYEGEAVGINERGELLVSQSCNIITAVMSGEVSVRGEDGYF